MMVSGSHRIAVLSSHMGGGANIHLNAPFGNLCASKDGESLVAVRRQGHQVPQELKSKQGSAVVFMVNPKAPPPSHAEKARTLMAGQRQGVLSTTHHELGAPYGTLINIATCPDTGMPFTVISRMAEHTQNLLRSPVCSVLVSEAQGAVDQLAMARCTLVGEMHKVEKSQGRRSAFLQTHPSATYVDFDDFQCWQLECNTLRYIGGFGEMSWVDAASFRSASSDPVATGSRGAVEHMNEDHQDATLAMTQAFGGLPQATSATILAIDRHGFEVLGITADGRRRTRVPFKSPLSAVDDIRPAVMELTQNARAALGLPPKSAH